jgi:hypothetical protein
VITLAEIIDIWKSIRNPIEPRITFPQADSFIRIIDLLSILFEHELTREEITLLYEFDPRQTNYYIAACEYLGLVERIKINRERGGYRLSEESKCIMALPYKKKNLALIKKIFECPVFYKAFGFIIQNKKIPDKIEINNIMSKSDLSINPTTIDRRSSTVRSWLDWILRIANTDDFDD